MDLEVYDGINLLVKSKDDENAMLNINFKKDKFEFTYNDVDENKILANFENGKYKIEATMDEEDILVDGTYNITDTNLEFTFNTEIMGEKYSGKIISKETISDDIKIDIPSNALDVEDEETQLTLMYEIEKMPIYDLIKPYIEPEEDYYDDNLYYLDAESVAYTSSRPQIQYNINVLRLSALEEFKNKIFNVGDRGYVEDTEFFGYAKDANGNITNTPYKEEILISEITSVFDSPEQDTITVQNYKT